MFDFTKQEVIFKYFAMTVKEKVTVCLVIDAIADKQKLTRKNVKATLLLVFMIAVLVILLTAIYWMIQ